MHFVSDFIPRYKKMKNTNCRSPFQAYKDVIEAQNSCNKNRHCFGIYAYECKRKPRKEFGLCYKEDIHTNYKNNCFFQKGIHALRKK